VSSEWLQREYEATGPCGYKNLGFKRRPMPVFGFHPTARIIGEAASILSMTRARAA